MATKPKRARTSKGHYKADDPKTPDVNEAFVQEETPAPKATAFKPDLIWYESREREPSMFDVADIGSIRNFTNGRLEWKVKPDDVERFESHHFFKTGRVVKKAG
tara:strand:- start:8573 stop:8884 length:312 start_codon:yes stop_codon:yes gene_type:complete